ncbi:hypothetical protein EVAR_50201_1 [Eumeta japonica]|uniref:Uncharacterized protein n=1 Tax=Eumeta variegata TaxID=151549 RepID=A0A4C1X0F1_EUMVA|nr:hypothetical protein EVAR_50201_1 [Eumeta japonica]
MVQELRGPSASIQEVFDEGLAVLNPHSRFFKSSTRRAQQRPRHSLPAPSVGHSPYIDEGNDIPQQRDRDRATMHVDSVLEATPNTRN